MKIICLIATLLFLVTSFVGCGDINDTISSDDNITEKISSPSVTQSNEETTTRNSTAITSQDVLDKVNECADIYDFPIISNYKETLDKEIKNFTFSYALSQYPNDSFGVIGMEDEKGISALHTTFIFNNTGFDGGVALMLSYIPAISCYCPDLDIEEAINKTNTAFQNATTQEENKRVFVSGEYEYTLNIGEKFMLISVIRNDIKTN